MSSFRSRFSRVLLACAVANLVAGCTAEYQQGDTSVFTFTVWIPALLLGIGCAAFLIGLFVVMKSYGRWGWALIVIAPLVTIIFAPSMLIERTAVSPRGFSHRTGMWFASRFQEVAFAELNEIELTLEKEPARRRERFDLFLVCHRKTGGNEKVLVNDVMKEGALAKIIDAAANAGVTVIDRTQRQ
jgi:hypothetical protein